MTKLNFKGYYFSHIALYYAMRSGKAENEFIRWFMFDIALIYSKASEAY